MVLTWLQHNVHLKIMTKMLNDSNLIHNKNGLFKKNYKSSLLEEYMYIRTE